jgi:hypothetical protein
MFVWSLHEGAKEEQRELVRVKKARAGLASMLAAAETDRTRGSFQSPTLTQRKTSGGSQSVDLQMVNPMRRKAKSIQLEDFSDTGKNEEDGAVDGKMGLDLSYFQSRRSFDTSRSQRRNSSKVSRTSASSLRGVSIEEEVNEEEEEQAEKQLPQEVPQEVEVVAQEVVPQEVVPPEVPQQVLPEDSTEQELPWSLLYDDASQYWYRHHAWTGETVWVVVEGGEAEAGALLYDEEHDHYYRYNTATGDTLWAVGEPEMQAVVVEEEGRREEERDPVVISVDTVGFLEEPAEQVLDEVADVRARLRSVMEGRDGAKGGEDDELNAAWDHLMVSRRGDWVEILDSDGSLLGEAHRGVLVYFNKLTYVSTSPCCCWWCCCCCVCVCVCGGGGGGASCALPLLRVFIFLYLYIPQI